jgi:hypothetical protein
MTADELHTPPTQAQRDAARAAERAAFTAMRSAAHASIAATEALTAANQEVQRLDALMQPLREWLLEYFDGTTIFRRPVSLAIVAKRCYRPEAEVAPVLAELVAEGLIAQVGKNRYLPAGAR